MSPSAVIEIKDLSFSYAGLPVLDRISLAVPERDFATVIGPNGGGKTTLLKIILGLLVPNEGTVRVFGRSPREARPRVSYMPQFATVDPLFPVSVLDVVLMGRLNKSRKTSPFTRTDRKEALRALDQVGLGELRQRPFSALSGGQRQRVLIARAIASRPELLLLDEPVANLDQQVERQFYDLLIRLNEQMTILLVSHDLGFVSQFVKSVICVNRRLIMHPTDQINGRLISEIYGHEMRMVRHDCVAHEEGQQ